MPIEGRKKARATGAAERPRFNQRKPTINIIGAGRLGTALALALAARGYHIEAIMARRLNHARRAAALLATGAQAVSVTRLDLLPPADLLFITTHDDRIAQAAACLADSFAKANHQGQRHATALHCSGALSSDVLSPLARVGLRTGSMHPLVSISEPVQGAERLRGAFFCVEGDAQAVRLARALVRDLEGHSFSIDGRDKALYHAAAVTASGHMVALFDIATEMLTRCGLTERRARAVLMPLVRSTLDNLSVQEPSRALTGTFARADIATVRAHLLALRKLSSRGALEAYLLLGARSLQLARENGQDAAAVRQLARALSEAWKSGRRE